MTNTRKKLDNMYQAFINQNQKLNQLKKQQDEAIDNFYSLENGYSINPKKFVKHIQSETGKKRKKEIDETTKKIEVEKLRVGVLKQNLTTFIKKECVKNVFDIWNNYAGKRHGEKTKEKIRKEIEEKTGITFYINIYRYEISLCYGSCANRIDVSTYLNLDKLLNDNVIQKVDYKDIFNVEALEYIDDFDQWHKNVDQLQKEINEKIKELKNLTSEYNKLKTDTMKDAPYFNEVNW